MSEHVAAALAAARDAGFATGDPVVVRDLTNVLVHLRPDPVVARVTVALQRGRAALETELAFAHAAAERGAPVVPPADGRVHEHGGFNVTLWRYVEHRPPKPGDAPAIGEALRALHEAVRDIDLPLERFDRLDEVEEVAASIEHPDRRLMLDAIAFARERVAAVDAPEQPLHGDAHHRNTLVTESGPVWVDLENICRGPVEYDLACLLWRTRVHGAADADASLAAYGPHDAELVEELLPVLAAFLVPWNVLIAQRSGIVDDRYLRERLEYLKTFV